MVPLTQVASGTITRVVSAALVSGAVESTDGSRPAEVPVDGMLAGSDSVVEPVQVTSTDEQRTLVVAFYADWGEAGYRSLERNIDKIDVLMPMWYHLGSDGKLTLGSPEGKERVMRLIKAKNPDMKVMPIVNNYDKRTETWNPKQVAKLLRKPARRAAISKRIVKTMRDEGFDGVNIDLEGFTAKDRKVIVRFMKALYPRANRAGLVVSQDVIVGSAAYDHRALAMYNDYLIPMMYDEHWKTSGPGPISSQIWYEKTLQGFFKKVPPEKVIVGLGTYAYDWGRPGQRAKSMTFKEATVLARKRGKTIKLHESQLNSYFTYRKSGVKHEVWILDAISAYNQVHAASRSKPAGFAFWRLGAEDPRLWQVLDNRGGLDKTVASSLETSKRSVDYDKRTGLITGQRTRP